MKRKTSGYLLVLAACLMLAGFVFFFFVVLSTSSNTSHTDKVLAATIAPVGNQVSNIPKNQPDNSAQEDAELQALIEKWVQSQSAYSQWSIAVKGLANTNLAADYQGSTVYESASIFKLYMIYALTKTVPQSQWSQPLPGDGRTIGQCVNAMLIYSDNACGIAMGNWLGWSKAHELARAAGYTGTILNLYPVKSTADDTLKFMTDLYDGKTFNPPIRQLMINDMRHSTYRLGIVAGCPGCTVANKTGDANGYDHDAAIITVDGKSFVLSVFSKNGSMHQIAEITNLIQQFIRSH